MTRAIPVIVVALIVPITLYAYLVARAGLFIAIISGAALAIFYTLLKPEPRRALGSAPFIMAIGLPLAAWMIPVLSLLIVVMAGLVPMLARSGQRVAPIYLFALLLLPPLDQTMAVGGLKLFDFGLHDALAGGAALCLWLRPHWRTPARPMLDLPVLALLALFVFVFTRGTSVTNVLRMAVDVGLDCGLPYYIVSRSIRTGADIIRCMLHLAAGAAILSCILCFEVATSWPIYNVLYDRYAVDLLLLVKNRGGMLRAGGPFLESTSMAMVLVFCFLAAWLAGNAFRSRAGHAALLLLLLLGLAAPQSRGAWLGLFVSMALVDLYRRQWRAMVSRGVVAGMAALALLAVAQSRPQLAESLGLSGTSSATNDYRQRLLDRGLEEFAHHPLLGHSRAELLVRLQDMTQGEGIVDFVNMHLYMALLGGLVGLGLFNGVFLYYLRQCWHGRGRLPPEELIGAAFTFGALATPLQMLLFTSMGGRVQIFVFVFFGLGTAVARQHRAAGAHSSGSKRPLAIPPVATPIPAAPSRISSSFGSNTPIR